MRVMVASWAAVFCIAACASQSHAKKLTIVCLGDSLTEGFGVEASAAYPSVLETLLRQQGHQADVISAGVSGSTSASGPGRVRWLMRSSPDIVVLALGANDGLRGLSTEALEQNLKATVQSIQKQGAKVLLAGMKMPKNYGEAYTRAFEAVYTKVAGDLGVPLIPFLLDGVALQPELNLPDGIHPNAQGHKIIARTVLKHLEPLL